MPEYKKFSSIFWYDYEFKFMLSLRSKIHMFLGFKDIKKYQPMDLLNLLMHDPSQTHKYGLLPNHYSVQNVLYVIR